MPLRTLSVRLQIDLDAADLPVGAVLWRWFRGRLYCVEIVDPIAVEGAKPHWWRYKYNGKRYCTLTNVAFAITGEKNLSGNRFFQLRKRRGKCRPKLTKG
jgi:hypothetical protein